MGTRHPNPFEGIFTESDTSTLAWAFGPSSSAHLLRKQIQRHVFNNPGDWSAEKLFDELGAFDAVDRRFAGFLEDLVSHQVVTDEELSVASSRRWLRLCVELRWAGRNP